VEVLERVGFVRDEFANSTRCVASEYHATYRGGICLPDDHLWSGTCITLQSDSDFIGCLEEEEYQDTDVCLIEGSQEGEIQTLPPLECAIPSRDKHKACDIHIGIERSWSDAVVHCMEHLECACFDKPTADGVRRIYTITCESIGDGRQLFDTLYDLLKCVPGLCGKMKLERTIRFLRVPDDAPTLPISTEESVDSWLTAARADLAKEIRRRTLRSTFVEGLR